MDKISKVHDHFFRDCMSDLRVATDFFQAHLPQKVLSAIDLNTLHLEKESFIEHKFKELITDMLYSVELKKGQSGYLYVLAEHQSTPDELMPFRLLRYVFTIMGRHMDRQKQEGEKQVLPLVVPLVFYHGRQTPYPYSLDVFDLFESDDQELAKETLLRPFNLVDVSQIPDEELKQRVWSGFMEMMQKHVFARDILPHVESIMPLLRKLETLKAEGLIIRAVQYTFYGTQMDDPKPLVNLIKNQLSREIGEETMTLAERLIEQGRQEAMTLAEKIEQRGVQKGMQQGRLANQTEIAQKLLAEGTDPAFVARVTDLSLEQVEALALQPDTVE